MDNSTSGATLALFICAGDDSDFDEQNTVSGTLVRDGKYHTLKIKIPDGKFSGDLHKFRFDPFHSAAAGDVMYIKSIKLMEAEYPQIGIENDMTLPGSENLPSGKSYTETYMDETENALVLQVAGGTDVSITLDFTSLFLSTQVFTGLEIEYMIPSANQKPCASSIYFATSDNLGFRGEQVVGSGRLVADGTYHTMTFDFTKKAEYWTGDITRLRFDYFDGQVEDGDVMYIKSIKLIQEPRYELDLTVGFFKSPFSATKYTKLSYDSANGILTLKRSGGDDVSVTMDFTKNHFSTGDYTKLVVRYMIPTTHSSAAPSTAVYFTTSVDGSLSESKSVYGKLVADGMYHYCVFDLSTKAGWSGEIATIRFDYFQNNTLEGELIYIDSIFLQ
jgi:hypothetical protein